jgi:DNA-binding winged helix-turn-helix (wHTH) protein/tetratricopeptide (TPR) repeat protein
MPLAEADPVELAHEPDFVLGRLAVSPVRRTLLRDDGAREVLEHRVMQVLVALAKAKGGVVTRDELTQSCWQGRVVGEDAINRVMSRLRKAAETIGSGSFRVETVTKIGYRLLVPEGEGADSRAPAPPPKISRRGLAAGGTLLYRQLAKPAISPEVASLLQQGRIAVAQGNREGASQAVGVFRRITEIAPDYADGWGLLGLAYARSAFFRPKGENEAMRERARAVVARARQFDPDNAYALLAEAEALPQLGRWIEGERLLRRAMSAHPDEDMARWMLGIIFNAVGRFDEAIGLFDRIEAAQRLPSLYYQHILALWGAGRLDRLDQMTSEAAALYPSQFLIWFVRFYILLHGGQPGAAIALGEDIENRPSGIQPGQFEAILAVARAARSRDPREIDTVMQAQFELAHEGSGLAENAIQFACLFGRLDRAFEIADAYYFDRGFAVPEARFGGVQGSYAPRDSRFTRFLFMPSTRAMRADPRFDRLTQALGLERYWREAGVQPDYRRA